MGVSDPARRGPNSWGAASLTPPLPICVFPTERPPLQPPASICAKVVQTTVLCGVGGACRRSAAAAASL